MPNWKKLIVSGSDANLNSLVVSGQVTASSYKGDGSQLTNINSASYASTASLATNVEGGKLRYIPLWSGSNILSASIMYQTDKGIFVGYDTNPHLHSAEGETLAVHSGETGVKNVIYAHGTFDDTYRVNIRNISSGVSASTNYKATSDVGNDDGGYVQMGINSSMYARTDQLGGPLDAYLFTTGSDLLLGTLSPDKRIILFTGPGDADNNARVYIDASGSVAINTSTPTPDAPEALIVEAITNSYNLITARANIDNYSQINIKNLSGGNSASADVVATANNGTETSNYIDMGINSDQYNQPNTVGGPNDAYLYSTGNMLHIGNATPGEHIMFFVGGLDSDAQKRLILEDTKEHSLIGDIGFTGSAKITQDLTVGGTIVAEKFIAEYVTSSVIYESGSTKFGDTADDIHEFTGSLQVLGTISGSLILPSGVVSSSTQAANWTVLSASYAPIILPDGVVSSSTQATGWTVLSSSFATTASAATSITFTPTTASFATTASAATSITFTPSTASFATTSSFAQNARLLNNTASAVFATTGSNIFNGTQTITGSLLTTTDIVVFSGSFTTSGSFAITGSLGVTSGITGSLLGSSSFATTASAATSITFTPSTASFATTASAATSITFTPTTASFATTASAATSITFTPVTASYALTASFIDGGFY